MARVACTRSAKVTVGSRWLAGSSHAAWHRAKPRAAIRFVPQAATPSRVRCSGLKPSNRSGSRNGTERQCTQRQHECSSRLRNRADDQTTLLRSPKEDRLMLANHAKRSTCKVVCQLRKVASVPQSEDHCVVARGGGKLTCQELHAVAAQVKGSGRRYIATNRIRQWQPGVCGNDVFEFHRNGGTKCAGFGSVAEGGKRREVIPNTWTCPRCRGHQHAQQTDQKHKDFHFSAPLSCLAELRLARSFFTADSPGSAPPRAWRRRCARAPRAGRRRAAGGAGARSRPCRPPPRAAGSRSRRS
jgi:rubredoxin